MEYKDFKITPEFLIALFTVIIAVICCIKGTSSYALLVLFVGLYNKNSKKVSNTSSNED